MDNIRLMSDTYVNEKVSVWAFFDKGIFPLAMNWRRRLVKFEKLIFSTNKRIGNVRITNLICASQTANFELEYNNETYSWKLKKVMGHE